MQITVFGASGKVGSLVVEEALRRGYTVVAFVHSHDLFSPSGKLHIVQGDIYSNGDIEKALRGSRAVISCLGSWGTPHKNVLTEAMRRIIPTMHEYKIERIVTLTGHGAYAPSMPMRLRHKLLLAILALFPAGKVFRDGEEHMRLLAGSGLRWTTLRSPVMRSFGSAAYHLDTRVGNQLATIPRKAVADALLDQLEADDFIGRAPVVHYK